MPAAHEAEPARTAVEDAVPQGEVEVVVLLHRERLVHRRRDGGGVGDVHAGQPARAKRVERGDPVQRRAHSVAADVDQRDREVIVVEPAVREGVATEMGGGLEAPFRDDPARAVERGWEHRAHVCGGVPEVGVDTVRRLGQLCLLALVHP